MTPTLSANTQAILLLTAPLIAGRGSSTLDLLSPTEYKRLARHMREIQRQPSDLIAAEAHEVLLACHPVIDESRLRRLLGRGFLLSQVIERWQSRAIWVVSRADPDYPRRLKARLREDAPPVLYGCGDKGVLDSGGLAVVGSRHVDDALIAYTMSVGRLAACAGKILVSGGAKGIDQAAMRGALEAQGNVCGVLADSLEKATVNREHRNMLLGGQLTLISPYDPNAGFNVGNAMQRNKLIYALADASLVVNSDVNKGGTWAGAIEQLNKFRFVPVYVRSTGQASAGLDALLKEGAHPWPNPKDAEALGEVLNIQVTTQKPSEQEQAGPIANERPGDGPLPTPAKAVRPVLPESEASTRSVAEQGQKSESSMLEAPSSFAPDCDVVTSVAGTQTAPISLAPPAEVLFEAVRASIQQLLSAPMKDTEVAAALEVSGAQAKAWLQRLVNEGMLEKKRPARYVVKQRQLLE